MAEASLIVDSKEEEKTCDICLDVVDEKNHLTSCKHLFCKSCIAKWFCRQLRCHGKLTCPTCRDECEINQEEWIEALSKPWKRIWLYSNE